MRRDVWTEVVNDVTVGVENDGEDEREAVPEGATEEEGEIVGEDGEDDEASICGTMDAVIWRL